MDWHVVFLKVAIYGFLLAFAAAFLLRRNKRWRSRCFVLLFILFPFAALSALEYSLVRLRWDTWLLGDYETIVDKRLHKDYELFAGRILAVDPEYFRHDRVEVDGFRVYRPIRVEGFHINRYGLRTREPAPKRAGVWRIAVLGGSTVWSRYVLDHDTIPGYLERYYRAAGRNDVEVYNLGLEGMTFATALRLLEKFQPVYRFDQAVFYQGVNDLNFKGWNGRDAAAAESTRLRQAGVFVEQFRLMKFLRAAYREWTRPAPAADDPVLQEWLEAKVAAYVRHHRAARDYCRAQRLRCDFFLQPALFHKNRKTAQEEIFWRNTARDNPYLETAYRAAVIRVMRQSPAAQRDVTDVLRDFPAVAFMDWNHATAAGHERIARRIFESLNDGKR